MLAYKRVQLLKAAKQSACQLLTVLTGKSNPVKTIQRQSLFKETREVSNGNYRNNYLTKLFSQSMSLSFDASKIAPANAKQ